MSSIEEAFYFETQAKMVAAVKQHDSQSRNSKDYFGVFQLHLQLRRLCNHGTYQKLFEKLPEADLSFDPDEVFESLRQREELICLLCNGTLNGLGDELETSMAIFTFCGHLTCSSCRPSYNASLQRTASGLQCHLCHKIVPSDSTTATKPDDHVRHHNRIASSITWNSNEKSRSSKVSTLIHDIKTDNSEGKRYTSLRRLLHTALTDYYDSIIFSCWTRSLDLVAHHLQQQQIAFTRIDGSYTLSQRKKILEIYDSDPDVRVLLMTTGTGAVGYVTRLFAHTRD
jgi:SNF2 family DNA or RNA helicase